MDVYIETSCGEVSQPLRHGHDTEIARFEGGTKI